MIFTIKQNDTRPPLEAQLTADGEPINLDMCGVRLHMRHISGQKNIAKQATVINAADGIVQVDWIPGDTDTDGIYRGEFEITYTDESKQTIPNDGYITIYIIPELG